MTRTPPFANRIKCVLLALFISAASGSGLGATTTLAGGTSGSADGVGTNAEFEAPAGVAVSPDGLTALISQSHMLRIVVISNGETTTLAGSSYSGDTDYGSGVLVMFNEPQGVAFLPDGLTALTADSQNHKIRKTVISSGEYGHGGTTTLAGGTSYPPSGTADGVDASFNTPAGVAISSDGLTALVTDYGNYAVRRIVISTGETTTLAGYKGSSGGTDGAGTNAKFYGPVAVAIFPDDSICLVTDSGTPACAT